MNALTTSALVVLHELATQGPMTPKDIRGKVSLSPRTVSDALRQLTDQRLCRKTPNLNDMRQPLYSADPARIREMQISLDQVRTMMGIWIKTV